jgi:hypothetical protein
MQSRWAEALEFFEQVSELAYSNPNKAFIVQFMGLTISSEQPFIPSLDIWHGECVIHLAFEAEDSLREKELVKVAEKLLMRGIKGSKGTQMQGMGFAIMSQLRRMQRTPELALPWAKKALDVSPKDSSSYESALHSYAAILMETNDLMSALSIAQQRVDHWMTLVKQMNEKSDVKTHHMLGNWLQLMGGIHERLGNKKLAMRFGEMGMKEVQFGGMRGAVADAEAEELFELMRNRPESTSDQRVCSNCFKIGNRDTLPKCSRCYSEFYCSVECQKKRWPAHREVCKKLVAEKKKTEAEKKTPKEKEGATAFLSLTGDSKDCIAIPVPASAIPSKSGGNGEKTAENVTMAPVRMQLTEAGIAMMTAYVEEQKRLYEKEASETEK